MKRICCELCSLPFCFENSFLFSSNQQLQNKVSSSQCQFLKDVIFRNFFLKPVFIACRQFQSFIMQNQWITETFSSAFAACRISLINILQPVLSLFSPELLLFPFIFWREEQIIFLILGKINYCGDVLGKHCHTAAGDCGSGIQHVLADLLQH